MCKSERNARPYRELYVTWYVIDHRARTNFPSTEEIARRERKRNIYMYMCVRRSRHTLWLFESVSILHSSFKLSIFFFLFFFLAVIWNTVFTNVSLCGTYKFFCFWNVSFARAMSNELKSTSLLSLRWLWCRLITIAYKRREF